MFTSIHDDALQRWEEPAGEYAVMADGDAACPAGDWVTGRNCARRGTGDWWGDASILDGPHVTFEVEHNGYTFTAAAADRDEAEMIATAFAHWAEGDVYIIGFEGNDGQSEEMCGVFTRDGIYPGLDEIKQLLGRG